MTVEDSGYVARDFSRREVNTSRGDGQRYEQINNYQHGDCSFKQGVDKVCITSV